jgi:MFS family permease
MFASGAVVGLSIGGIIVQHFGWRYTFFTIIPIAICLLIVIKRYVNINETKLKDTQKNEQLDKKRLYIAEDQGDTKNLKVFQRIDVKGAILLAVMVTSFLLMLTLIETTSTNQASKSPSYIINHNSGDVIAFTFMFTAIASFILFVIIEKRSRYPLVDFRLLLNKAILPANLIIMIVGLSMFMVFQTIPILVRNPEPVGFGEDAISTGKVQLPFAIILLIFGPTSGLIISKLGSLKPLIAGTVITAISFFGLLMLHYTEFLVSINLAILSTGLSLTSVGAMNVIILSTPRQFSGISLGMSSLMRIVGSAVGPTLAGMYMQTNESLINIDGIIHYFPGATSFNLIFLTAAALSIASVALAIFLRKKVLKMSIPNLA